MAVLQSDIYPKAFFLEEAVAGTLALQQKVAKYAQRNILPLCSRWMEPALQVPLPLHHFPNFLAAIKELERGKSQRNFEEVFSPKFHTDPLKIMLKIKFLSVNQVQSRFK